MEHNENLLNNDLQIDGTAYTHLKETAMWAKFLGIVGFVLSALLVIVAIFAGTFMAKIMQSSPYNTTASTSMGAGFLTILYLIIAGISFFMSLLVYRFGTRTKKALLTTDQASLNAGLGSLKIMFRVYGIIMVIYLGVVALALIGGIAAAAFMK